MRPTLLALILLTLPLASALPIGRPVTVPLEEGAVGFATHPLVPIAAPTAINFGADGNLYATDLAGDAERVDLSWTPAGPVVTGVDTLASGFAQPLGIALVDGQVFVTDSHANAATGRTDGVLYLVHADGSRVAVVDGLPNGRHNTNHLRLGPDGRLYIANGNPNDHGCPGGDCGGDALDVFPYSGALLSVDVAQVVASPAVLHWTHADGTLIPENDIAAAPENQDFASKVSVLAHGFRNVFGLAFRGTDVYTAMNGADSPSSQDALFHVTPGADYGFPFCYNVGSDAGIDVSVAPNPSFPTHDCTTTPRATALIGWHACATGIDVPTAGGLFAFKGVFRDSVYAAECTAFFPETDHSSVRDNGHRVVRVQVDPATGEATGVTDFVTGLALPTDVRFGPDGAMYVADAGAILRVADAV